MRTSIPNYWNSVLVIPCISDSHASALKGLYAWSQGHISTCMWLLAPSRYEAANWSLLHQVQSYFVHRYMPPCLGNEYKSCMMVPAESVWQNMLSKWQTDPDIQEAERGLYAMPWTPNAALLQQTLDIALRDEKVSSRSPGNSLAAMLRSVGSHPTSDGVPGADVAWQWVQANFAEGNAAQ